ncbi:MAG: PleD family two-component system response regulator [Chloroflexota bacterium]
MARIVIADDEPHVRTLLRLILQPLHEVMEAADGVVALRMATMEHPDLVMLDLAMPGLTGIEVCEALRRDPDTAHIPVMIVTANGAPSDRINAHEAGANAFVTKPFSPATILHTVTRLLTAESVVAPLEQGQLTQ